MKQVAPASISFIAWLDDIISIPSLSGNTTLRRLQSMTMWLLYNQSIPIIIYNPSIDKLMRFALNLRPATSIGHPTHIQLVDTYLDAGVTTINSHLSSHITSLSLLTHSLDTNEWVALESYNTTTSW